MPSVCRAHKSNQATDPRSPSLKKTSMSSSLIVFLNWLIKWLCEKPEPLQQTAVRTSNGLPLLWSEHIHARFKGNWELQHYFTVKTGFFTSKANEYSLGGKGVFVLFLGFFVLVSFFLVRFVFGFVDIDR